LAGFLEGVDCAKTVLAKLNREFKRPLSLLMVNAGELECLLKWEPWLRRVAIFAQDYKIYYHLVAKATGQDFFTRFNFKLRVLTWDKINSYQQLAWPYDVINVRLDPLSVNQGLNNTQAWRKLLSTQIGVSSSFLLMIQGQTELVNEAQSYLNQIKDETGNGLVITPTHCITFLSQNIPSAFHILSVSNNPIRQRINREEPKVITDLMLWGEVIE